MRFSSSGKRETASNPESELILYTYDNIANGNGRLKKVSSSISATEYTGFDQMGRVTAHKTTDGVEYATAYAYRLDGSLDEQTYPSGRVVKSLLDASGDLATVKSKKTSASGWWNYADSFKRRRCGYVDAPRV